MSNNKSYLKSNIVVFTIIAIGIATRFIPHPPNFTAIGAIALFGGAYFSNKRIALIVPLVILILTDILLELFVPGFGLHKTIPFVYVSFFLITLMGLYLRNRKKVHYIAGASIISSILFFVISNFGSRLMFYPATPGGLSACYIAAIPFFHYTVLGDLLFNGIFFTSAYLVFQKSSILSTVNE